MKRALLLIILSLNFFAFPAWAEGEVIIDRITKEQAEELNIVIPPTTPPGFHSITIEVYDESGVVKDKEIPFCKNLRGEISWENKCPDVAELASFDQLMKIKVREDLPPYSPAQEPEKSSGLQVTALAALAALAGSQRAKGQSQKTSSESEGSETDSDAQQEELTSIDSGKLAQINREQGWGDKSRTWQMPFTLFSDYFFTTLTLAVSRFSPLLARTTADGSYLRAMFGGYSLFVLPLGIVFGVKAVIDTGGQALAPLLLTVLAIVAIAILDAFAGAIAAAVFFIGTLVAGGIASRSEALTILGVMAIFIAPALLASSIRPLRRLVSTTDGKWERLTDYALAVLLTGWLVNKMVNALNGLSGVQLALTYQANTIAFLAATFVLLRMMGEDFATYLYPTRLQKVSVELNDPSRLQQVTSSVIKVAFFLLLATPYVGVNLQLALAGIIFVTPLIAGLTFVDSLPKFEILDRFLPKATLKLVLLTIIGSLLMAVLQALFSDPTEFLRWAFVIAAIPGLLVSVVEWFSAEPKHDWKSTRSGRWAYRLAGFLVFLITIQMVRGADLTGWMFS